MTAEPCCRVTNLPGPSDARVEDLAAAFRLLGDPTRLKLLGILARRDCEEVCACVILKGGCSVTEAELIAFVRDGLSRFKAPRYVMLMDAFPMTASGKIQKFKLREMGVEHLGLQNAANIETA